MHPRSPLWRLACLAALTIAFLLCARVVSEVGPAPGLSIEQAAHSESLAACVHQDPGEGGSAGGPPLTPFNYSTNFEPGEDYE